MHYYLFITTTGKVNNRRKWAKFLFILFFVRRLHYYCQKLSCQKYVTLYISKLLLSCYFLSSFFLYVCFHVWLKDISFDKKSFLTHKNNHIRLSVKRGNACDRCTFIKKITSIVSWLTQITSLFWLPPFYPYLVNM